MSTESQSEYPLDDYGFCLHMPQEKADELRLIAAQQDARQAQNYQSYISKVGGLDKVNFKDEKVKNMIRSGIPRQYRPYFWLHMTGAAEKMAENPGYYNELKGQKDRVPQSVSNCIGLDVPRTFNGSTAFSPEQLTNVLYAFACVHPEIGYCQSLNFLAAMFLVALQSEEAALWLLCVFIEKYMPPSYYCNSMKDFQIDLRMLELLFEERTPDVYKHAQSLKVQWLTFVAGWILTSFSSSLQADVVFRIWDSLFLEGQKIIFRVAIAIIRKHQDAILASTDISSFTRIFTELQNNLFDSDELMTLAFNIKAFSRKHLQELRESASAYVNLQPDHSGKLNRSLHSLFGHFNM